LSLIVMAGFAVRLAYLNHAVSTPGFAWDDPDGYMRQALRLANGGAGWRWTFEAVIYHYNYQDYVLPPLYTVFLSVFALFPNFPFSALVAQVVLNSLAILLVFELGRLIHSPAAGVVSAGAYAAWIPNIFSVWSTSQENLYIPLVLLAFVGLARAMLSRSPAAFGIAGMLFGLAALTRSMPMFFLPPAAVLYAILADDRRRAAREAAILVAGVLVVTIPYSIALSQHFQQIIVIDSHGSVALIPGARAETPGIGETAGAIVREIVSQPLGYAAATLDRARSLLHVNGGRILQIYIVAASEWQASLWKVLVHAGTDGLLMFSTILAGVGAALSRRPQIAAQVLLWAVVNIAVASIGVFAGARLRAPFEPPLMVLGAVCVTGCWRRPRRAALLAGIGAGVLAAAAIVPQIPRSLRARADYGIVWPSIFSRGQGTFAGRAGFSAIAGADGVTFSLESQDRESGLRVQVRVEEVLARTIEIPPGEARTVQVSTGGPGLVFVELEPAEPRPAYPAMRLVR
jgi:hypothetical protein